jgi:lysozyme family protein
MLDFDTAIERALSHEGGYVNDPRDPGGETQWGISKRSYPEVDIRRLTRDGAKGLYRRDFWEPVVQTVADDALRFQMLDAAINHGIGNAVRFLQRAVGVADDGHWGRISHEALGRVDATDVHLLFMAERFEFWTKLKSFDTFGRGWTKRGAQNLRYLAQDNSFST